MEFLVGITVGLFLLAGATSMLTSTILSSRNLLTEARVNQELRTAADLITRDLRRGSYWENAVAGATLASGATSTTANPHGAVAVATTSTAATITYSLSRDSAAGRTDLTELNTSNSDEAFGFAWADGQIRMQTSSGTWQSVTDPGIVTITGLTITSSTTPLDLRAVCLNTCTTNCPAVTVRRYDMILTGQAASDSSLVRILRTSVRVRNEQTSGACPT